MSDEPLVAWIKAITAAQAEFPSIGKDTSVSIKTKLGNYSYKYAALPDILDAVAPILRKHGLVILQSVDGDGASISVTSRIYHSAGHVEIFGPLSLRVADADAKAAGSAITYARRYALCAALNIAPDEDDDGVRASVQTASSAPEIKDEPAEPDAWNWLWSETAIFKAWSKDERLTAVHSAMKYLAIEEVTNREDADRIFSHMTGVYESRPSDGQQKLV